MRENGATILADVAKFMVAAGQTVVTYNPVQAALYEKLIDEEYGEMNIGKGASVELYFAFGNWYIVASDGIKEEGLN
jgi:hypothetical protein